MIRLVANISVEQIQRNSSSEAPLPLAIPARSGGEQQLRDHMNPPIKVGVANTKVGVANTKVGVASEKAEVASVDLTELKRQLDKAYRTPTPSISVSAFIHLLYRKIYKRSLVKL